MYQSVWFIYVCWTVTCYFGPVFTLLFALRAFETILFLRGFEFSLHMVHVLGETPASSTGRQRVCRCSMQSAGSTPHLLLLPVLLVLPLRRKLQHAVFFWHTFYRRIIIYHKHTVWCYPVLSFSIFLIIYVFILFFLNDACFSFEHCILLPFHMKWHEVLNCMTH